MSGNIRVLLLFLIGVSVSVASEDVLAEFSSRLLLQFLELWVVVSDLKEAIVQFKLVERSGLLNGSDLLDLSFLRLLLNSLLRVL